MIKYNVLSEVQSGLLQKQIIDLAGDVDQDMFTYAREAIMRLIAQDAPEIEIVISSKGGDCEIGLHIYDIIKSYSGNTFGTVLGFANSMATIILQACDVRQATKHAIFLLHNPHLRRVDWDELNNENLLKKRRQELVKHRSQMIDIYLAKTGRTHKQIEATLKKDQYMTAEEALKFGLIDCIIKPEKHRKELSK